MARFPVNIVVVLPAIVGPQSGSRVSTQISKRSMGYTFVSDVMTQTLTIETNHTQTANTLQPAILRARRALVFPCCFDRPFLGWFAHLHCFPKF